MAPNSELELKHSVAFRVTEEQWRRLKNVAAKQGITVPQLAKRSLFDAARLEQEASDKRVYGQAKSR